MQKNELQTLSNVLEDDYGFKFVLLMLRKLGAFDNSINRNLSDRDVFMHLGKREKGSWLLNCCFKANRKKYVELLAEQEKEN